MTRTEDMVQPQPGQKVIKNGATGYDYNVLFGDYIRNARSIRIRDSYIVNHFQYLNMERFLYSVQNHTQDRVIVRLETKQAYDRQWTPDVLRRNIGEQQRRLDELTTRFIKNKVRFHWEYNNSIHDRHIIVDEIRWKIILGRGLDIYQRLTDKQQNEIRAGISTYRDMPCHEFNVTYINDF